MNKSANVLASKYRPQTFEDLIGQELVAETIINSIKSDKIPNAYLFTGIRGVGKTTIARIVAKSLNCLNGFENLCKDKFCSNCESIASSSHIDVLEMDAASKTGIDDVRELIENSKYSPTSAKFKIFIIDEVHMLSKQAFNGLLKTLEEPPSRLKFILATTEVRKIPVTILSRCQRFDLKRVSLDLLLDHLQNISKKENGKITDDALRLIARASEGSVRDAISLLDRALISQNINEKNEIEDKDVRQMLGLADRSKTIELFKEILLGDQKSALLHLKELIENGLDAKNFLNDILEILYLFGRRVNLGPIKKDMMVSESEVQLIEKYSTNLDMYDLGLFWQLTIKTMNDLNIVGNENLTLEMYVMQLIHLKSIDQNKGLKININENTDVVSKERLDTGLPENKIEKKINNPVKNQLKSTEQVKENIVKRPQLEKNKKSGIEITSFNDLLMFATKEKEFELKFDLERNVNLVSFNKGKIDISFNEKLNKNFIKNLTEKLLKWTGERWIISLSKKVGEKTVYEKELSTKNERITKEKNNKVSKELFSAFPDAKLIEVKEEDA